MKHIRKAGLAGTLVLGLAVLPLLAPSASAAVISTSARPLAPAVGYASTDGSFLVVWAEDRGLGTGLDLYGARTNASGIAVGFEVPVLVAAGNQSDPALVWSEHNRAYLLVYTDDRSGALPTPGAPVPPTSGLPTPGVTTPTPPLPPLPLSIGARAQAGVVGPGMAGAQADASLAGWQSPGQLPPTIMPPTVGPPPTGLPPLPTPATPAPGPSATPDPNGPPAPPTTSGSRDLYGTWLSASGQRVTSTFGVVTSPADDTYPSLGYVRTPEGEDYALVWREVTGVNAAISVMRLDGLGFFFLPSAKFSVAAGGDLGRPSVAGEATERDWFAVWSSTPADEPARNIYGRKLNSNGVPLGPVRLVAGGPADQAYPSIGSLGLAGGFILAWENRVAGAAPDIRVRRLNPNGVPYSLETDLAGGPPFSFAPNIASSDSFSTLLVWLDRNAAGDNSILAAQVNRDGRRLGPERLVVRGGAGPSGVTPVIPPPGLPTLPVPYPPGPTAPLPGPTAPLPPLPTP